jgi:hypothetical protein
VALLGQREEHIRTWGTHWERNWEPCWNRISWPRLMETLHIFMYNSTPNPKPSKKKKIRPSNCMCTFIGFFLLVGTLEKNNSRHSNDTTCGILYYSPWVQIYRVFYIWWKSSHVFWIFKKFGIHLWIIWLKF